MTHSPRGECRASVRVGVSQRQSYHSVSSMLKIPYEELSMAFDFVSFDGVGTHAAYISLETGRIYWISEDSQADEEVPEDIEDSDRYFLVPHKRDLDLGTHLVLRFAAREWPEQLETIREMAIYKAARGALLKLRQESSWQLVTDEDG